MGGGITPVFARHGILPPGLTVPIFCDSKLYVCASVCLEHTISSRVVSHAISDLAGRYANCIPSFGGLRRLGFTFARPPSLAALTVCASSHVRETDTRLEEIGGRVGSPSYHDDPDSFVLG